MHGMKKQTLPVSHLRLFLALWPSPECAALLEEWAAWAQLQCGGRIMRPETLHLTLAFLGAVEIEKVDALMTCTRRFSVTPGAFTVSRFGTFPRTDLVWAGPAGTVPELATLHYRLWQTLVPLNGAVPAQPFRPHITLLRRVTRPLLLPDPPFSIEWAYSRCVLVVSEPGSRYRILAESQSGG